MAQFPAVFSSPPSGAEGVIYRRLVFLALALTVIVVVLGAYVRLSDAGLGCPDWPGCYGQVSPEHAAEDIARAEAGAPHGPVSQAKAWKEMVHRYLAGSLGILILCVATVAWCRRREREVSLPVALLLVGVVVCQGLLGKWTVTLLLKPAIVTGHLLGGLTTLALLACLALRASGVGRQVLTPGLARALRVGLVLVAGQIALGGWTSTNYAALACADFPTCQGAWWPAADYTNAFHLLRELGVTPEGDVLPVEALVAIHWTHRLGALVVSGYLVLLGLALVRRGQSAAWGGALLAALTLQIGLGVANVVLALPLPLAVAHNAGAVVLLLIMVGANYRYRGARASVWSGRQDASAYA